MRKKIVLIGAVCVLVCGCVFISVPTYEKTCVPLALSKVIPSKNVLTKGTGLEEDVLVYSDIQEGVGVVIKQDTTKVVEEVKEDDVPKSQTKVDDNQGNKTNNMASNTTSNMSNLQVSQSKTPQVPEIKVPEVVENEWDIVESRNDVVYASESLNIRDYPSVSASEVAVARKGDELHRVGICRNGWSQVDFYGQLRYCSSDYLSDKQVFSDMMIVSPGTKIGDSVNGIPECDGRLGDVGRLMIPDVGYSVALFDGSGMGEAYAQSLVDGWDSADYESNVGQSRYIADHNTDGFESMKSSVPGSTLAYIYWTDGSCTTYKCAAIHHNALWRYNGGDSVDENGVPITKAGYDLVMQTCNSDDGSIITVSYWNKL